MIFRSVSNEASGCTSSEVGSRIGLERRFNPALRHRDREGFVRALTESIPPRPTDRIIANNRRVLMLQRPAPARLEPRDLGDRLSAGAVLVDARDPRTFGAGHVAGSLNVWIDGPQFGERAANNP
jgi:hypothetical protein